MEFEGRSRISSTLGIAPLIDVMMILLIFFMLTTTFLLPEAIELNLPSSSTAVAVEDLPLVVLLDAEGNVALGDETMSREELTERMTALLVDPETQVVSLKTDEEVSVQHMLEIMDLLRTAGWRNVSLATEPVESR